MSNNKFRIRIQSHKRLELIKKVNERLNDGWEVITPIKKVNERVYAIVIEKAIPVDKESH